MSSIRLTKNGSFSVDADLRMLRAALAAKQSAVVDTKDCKLKRLYLLDSMLMPVVIFDGVDHFNCIAHWENRGARLVPGEKKTARLAVFSQAQCLGIDWIGQRSVINLCVLEAAQAVMNPADPDGNIHKALRRALDNHQVAKP